MTETQVISWVAAGESESQEFKQSTNLRHEATQTLCGMMNKNGGRVIFGVTPDHQLRGLEVSDRTLEKLWDEFNHFEPPAFPEVERVPLTNGLELIVVTVSRGSQRPYSFKGKKFIRVAASTVQLSEAEANNLLLERLHGTQRWENEIADGYTVDDLDTREIRLTLEESIRRGRSEDPNTRDPLEILRGFGLLARGSDALLKASVVLFGRSEALLPDYPQCLLRLARFRGVDKTEFLDNKQLQGHAFSLLRSAERFLVENLPIAGRIQPGIFERIDSPLYPPEAMREALANAICHRDYSIGGGSVGVAVFDDRLEITSSGDLHFGLTPQALFEPHESLPWNPIIAKVFYRRGIVESWGRGTLKMLELTQAAGLPRPNIDLVAGAVTVRFLPLGYVAPSRINHELSDVQRGVLSLLGQEGRLALSQIVGSLQVDMPTRSLQKQLALLEELGLVVHEGQGRGAKWRLV
jgi:ATP-dependent DNA helicase RecG